MSDTSSNPSADSDTRSLATTETNLKDLTDEQIKRYTFLLGQSELFYHFLKLDEHPDLAKELKALASKNKPKDKSRRHRKTEAEEDKELVDGVEEEESSPFVFTSSPPYISNGTMRDYQVQGLNWLISLNENNLSGILADEMGLGKTLQVISFLGFLRHYRGKKGPHLVVVPKTTLYNWKKEFEKWTPEVNAFLFHGDKATRPNLIKEFIKPVNFDVCITSYEMCLLEKSSLSKINWEYIVIDEAHRIKNEASMLSKIVRVIKSNHRLLITGTPLQNNLHELWALLNFLLPDVFGSSEDFDAWFENQSGDQDSIIQQLHKVLNPFLLRRIKSDVEKSLLPKKEINLYVGLTTTQRKLYQKILEKDIDAVNGAGGKKEGKVRLQNVVMHLRKCCNHPYLFDGIEPGPPYTNGEHLVDSCGKMVVLDRLLKRLKAQGSRVLIFSQMSRLLDILEDYCEMRDYKYCRIDGQTSHEERIDAIDNYNAPDSEKFLFLLTTRAGGLGINLVTADIVIIFDSDWNPQADLQAQDRAHRIGQTKQVYVFRFVTENAIEEKVMERAAQKLRLDQLVIQQGRLSQQQKASSKEDLLAMIQHGAQDMFNSTESTVTEDDIDNILRRGEEKTKELTSKYSQIGIEDLAKFTSESTGSVYLWEGDDYNNKRKDDGSNIGNNWIQPAKRERKVNYAIDDYYREAMRVTPKNTAPRAPRPPKHPNFYDFQFLPKELLDIYQKEIYHYRRTIGYKAGSLPSKDDSDKQDTQEEIEAEQKKIDEAEPLTEEEQELKDKLSDKGFSNWSKREFSSFIKSMEKNGRDAIDIISEEVENKTPEEVKEYYKVFWKRYTEISDYQKFVANIERGEQRLRRQNDIQQFLSTKLKQYKMPLFQLKIPYGQSKGKFYSEEEDRFLVIKLAEFGFGNEDVYERIRDSIRSSDLFRFNWFIKSRTSQEINRRCNTLVTLLSRDAGLNF